MATLTLRSVIFVAAALCIVSGDHQKTPLLKNEKTGVGFPKLWKLKKAEYSLGATDEGDPGKGGNEKNMLKEKAMEKLQEVFGVPGDGDVAPKDNPRRRKHKQVPPLFMTKLYKEVADPYSGVSRGEKPFGADVIRSYIERGSTHSDFLIFNVSGLASTEQVVEAEIHLYRMRSTARLQYGSGDNKFVPPYYLIRVYQALSNDTSLPVDSHRLLSMQHVSDISSPGWHVLNVREAVLDWITGSRLNLGLIVTISSPTEGGERRLTRAEVRIARRNEHHNSKQPILVLFNMEGNENFENDVKLRHPSTGYPSYYKRVHNEEGDEQLIEPDERRRRESPLPRMLNKDDGSNHSITTPTASEECVRRDLYVDFEEIGWDPWIIAPAGYDSHQCLGRCDFPLGQGQNPSNHAIVQSVVHELGTVHELGMFRGVKKPCCVPSSLLPLNVLYFDNGNVVLRVIKDMVVERCGCR